MTATMQKTKPKPSRLGQVVKGSMPGPTSFCFYGPESVGKTTLAACSPDPIFIDIEGGSRQLNTSRYEFEGGIQPKTFQEILDAVTDITNNEHEFKTLVIDSLDRMESMVHDHIVKEHSMRKTPYNEKGHAIEEISGFDWGKGYTVAENEFKKLFAMLEDLKEKRKMNIVFVCHSFILRILNPIDDDYDRYTLRLYPGSAKGTGDVIGLVKEWVDVLGFCSFEEGGGSAEKGKRSRGYTTHRRLVHLRRGAAFDAKSRIPMPDEIELDINDPWAPFQRALDVGLNATREDLLPMIAAELERIGDKATTDRVRAECKKGTTEAPQLGRILMDLKNKQPISTESEETNE